MTSQIETYELNNAETGYLLESLKSPNYVSSDADVLIVGPGAIKFFAKDSHCGLLPMDPSLITLAHHLSSGSGSVTVLDLNPDDEKGGIKDWISVKSKMDNWKDLGARFSPYFFIEGDILNPPQSLKKYDTIIDHMSWRSIGGVKFFSNLAMNYESLLDDDGKLICYFNISDTNELNILIESLFEQDLKCTKYIGLNEKYRVHDFAILNDLFNNNYSRTVVYDDYLKPWHKASGFIVAQH